MTLRNMLTKSLIGLWIILAMAVIPQPAEAVNIQMTNPYSQTMWAAVVFFDDAAGKWGTQGWFKIEPHGSRNPNFSNSTKRDFVYIHAHTSEASWGDSGENAIRRTVIKEEFRYYDGETCPAGSNRRQVKFDKWYMENDGIVYWNP